MKNITNKFMTTAFIVVLILSLTSCDAGLTGDGYQDNPNNTGSAPAPNVIGLAELTVGVLNESDNSRYAGINANYLSGLSQQFAPINNYVYTPEDFNRLWTTIYRDGLKPAKIAEAYGVENNDAELIGTSKLLQAILLSEAAINWGDVPNSEANVAGIIEPVYDGQASVLQHCLNLLNGAISNGGSSMKYFNDGIGGTATSSTIAQLANSIKARIYLFLEDYPNALIAAQNGIQNANGNLILKHTSQIGAQNMYYQFLVIERGGYIGPANSYLEKMLNATDLSVTRSLVTPGDSDRYNYYYNSSTEFNTTSGIFSVDESSTIISYYETKLIEAEAAYRTSQEILALGSLNDVRDALASKYGGAFPHSTATGALLLKHILEEKYISIFPSPQTFHDLSRTNNILGVTPKAGTELPKRYLYPQGEIDANSNLATPIPGIFVQTPIY